MSAAGNVDPQALVAALKAAGFVVVGHGRAHVRMVWPGRIDYTRNLMVPTDPTAPEFGQIMSGVLAELENAVTRGEAAAQVLNRVVDPLVEEGA